MPIEIKKIIVGVICMEILLVIPIIIYGIWLVVKEVKELIKKWQGLPRNYYFDFFYDLRTSIPFYFFVGVNLCIGSITILSFLFGFLYSSIMNLWKL